MVVFFSLKQNHIFQSYKLTLRLSTGDNIGNRLRLLNFLWELRLDVFKWMKKHLSLRKFLYSLNGLIASGEKKVELE